MKSLHPLKYRSLIDVVAQCAKRQGQSDRIINNSISRALDRASNFEEQKVASLDVSVLCTMIGQPF